MTEVETHSIAYHSPPSSLTGPSKRDGPSYPHGSQGSDSEGFGANQGSDGGSASQSESFQPLSEDGASPTGPDESLLCTRCPGHAPFAQKQGLKRHCREVHGPRLECPENKCKYKWTRSREAEYRRHLRGSHRLEDDKIDERLGRRARHRRRKGSVIRSDQSPHFLPPPIGRDQCLAEPHQRPLTPPPLDAVKDTNAVPPLIPSVAHRPWLGHAKPSGLEDPAPAFAFPVLLSKGYALLDGHYIAHERYRFPSTLGEWGSTTSNIPFNPRIPHSIPALPYPVSVYQTVPISGDGAILGPVVDLKAYQAQRYNTDIA